MADTNDQKWIKDSWLIILAEILLLLSGVFLLTLWNRLPPEVPWFYSLPWGERQLIPKVWLALSLPITAIVGVVNLTISKRIYRSDVVVTLVIGGATLLWTLMYLAALFRVVTIIT